MENMDNFRLLHKHHLKIFQKKYLNLIDTIIELKKKKIREENNEKLLRLKGKKWLHAKIQFLCSPSL